MRASGPAIVLERLKPWVYVSQITNSCQPTGVSAVQVIALRSDRFIAIARGSCCDQCIQERHIRAGNGCPG